MDNANFVARYVADRLMVMYAGRIVESGPIEAVLSSVPDPRAPLSVTSESDRGEPGDRSPTGLPVPVALLAWLGSRVSRRCH